jgi:hypothetical protein
VLPPAVPGTLADDEEPVWEYDGWVEILPTLSTASDTVLSWLDSPVPVVGAGNGITARVTAEDGSRPQGSVVFTAVSTSTGQVTALGTIVLVPVAEGVSSATVYAALPADVYSVEAEFVPAPGSGLEGSRARTQPGGHYTVSQGVGQVAIDAPARGLRAGVPFDLGARVGLRPPARGVPTGTVAFEVDGIDVGGPVVLSGGHGSVTAVLKAGSHVATAVYSGDSQVLAAVSDQVVFTVDKAVPTVVFAVSDVSGDTGTPSVGDVQVLPAPSSEWVPTGQVAVFASGVDTPIAGPVDVDGSGRARVGLGLARGPHRLYAVYLGDDDHESAMSGVVAVGVSGHPVRVEAATSVSPVLEGESVEFSARVVAADGAGFPVAGFVQFTVDGAAAGAPRAVSGGVARTVVAGLTAGSHQIRARFVGDEHFDPAESAPLTQVVLPVRGHQVRVDVATSASPVVEGVAVEFSAHVVPAHGAGFVVAGRVQFTVDGTAAGAPATVSGGVARTVVRGLTAGSHLVRARFLGDTHFDPADSGSLTQVVLPIRGYSVRVDVTTSVSPVVEGTPVEFSALVSGLLGAGFTPGGNVQFTVDGTAAGPAATVEAGVARVSVAGLTPGTHQVLAKFLGDQHYDPAESPAIIQLVRARPLVAPATLTVTRSTNPSRGIVTLKARATPAVEGHSTVGHRVVVFAHGKAVARTVTDKNGLAVVALREKRLRLGDNPIVVRYYSNDPRHLTTVSAHTTIRVKPRVPVTVALDAKIEPRRGDLIVQVRIARKIDGYGIRGRLVGVRVAGKIVATTRTDRYGRAAVVLRGSQLPVGATAILVDCFSGSMRFAKGMSKTMIVHVNPWHRATNVEAVR